MTKNEKISNSLKKYYAERGGSPKKGKPGAKHTSESRKKIGQALKGTRRTTEKQRKARNKANVYAWRARKYNAVVETSDMELIKLIYEHCPDGYHVDHVVALASGGLHHQDNLQYLEVSENCRKGKGSNFDDSKALSWKDFIRV